MTPARPVSALAGLDRLDPAIRVFFGELRFQDVGAGVKFGHGENFSRAAAL